MVGEALGAQDVMPTLRDLWASAQPLLGRYYSPVLKTSAHVSNSSAVSHQVQKEILQS